MYLRLFKIFLNPSSSSKSRALHPTHSPFSTLFFQVNVPALRFFLHLVLVAPVASNFSPFGHCKMAFLPFIKTLIPSGIVRSDFRHPEASVKAYQGQKIAELFSTKTFKINLILRIAFVAILYVCYSLHRRG